MYIHYPLQSHCRSLCLLRMKGIEREKEKERDRDIDRDRTSMITGTAINCVLVNGKELRAA